MSLSLGTNRKIKILVVSCILPRYFPIYIFIFLFFPLRALRLCGFAKSIIITPEIQCIHYYELYLFVEQQRICFKVIAMNSIKPNHAGIIFALITAISLGVITTQAKIFYGGGGNAMTLMLTRFLISTLVFGLLIRSRGRVFNIDHQQRLPVFMLGLVWSGAMICYLLSVETISVSLAVLILYTYPLLVLAYSVLVKLVSPSPLLISIFCLAFLGLYLALSGGPVKLDSSGMMFASLAALGAAYTFIKGARVAPRLNPLIMTFWINTVGLVMIIPLVYTQFSLSTASSGLIALAAATLFYLIAILCQFEALARLPAATAALILNLEPVVSILLAAMVLQERLSGLQWLGVALVISVLFVAIRYTADSSISARR
jgi:drug/metabolite transporter (DMT)-like permease